MIKAKEIKPCCKCFLTGSTVLALVIACSQIRSSIIHEKKASIYFVITHHDDLVGYLPGYALRCKGCPRSVSVPIVSTMTILHRDTARVVNVIKHSALKKEKLGVKLLVCILLLLLSIFKNRMEHMMSFHWCRLNGCCGSVSCQKSTFLVTILY